MKRPTTEAKSAKTPKASLASQYGTIGCAAVQAALLFARKAKPAKKQPA